MCHSNIALFVARESVLIHYDEVRSKFMSQMLDRKVYLNIDAKGFVTSDTDEANKNGGELDVPDNAMAV